MWRLEERGAKTTTLKESWRANLISEAQQCEDLAEDSVDACISVGAQRKLGAEFESTAQPGITVSSTARRESPVQVRAPVLPGLEAPAVEHVVGGLPVVECFVAVGHVVHNSAQQPSSMTPQIRKEVVQRPSGCRPKSSSSRAIPNTEEGKKHGLEAKHDVAIIRQWGIAFALHVLCA